MECPHCHSKKTQKFGFVKDKQRYRCKKCDRCFQSSYEQQGYSPDVREICLKMYLRYYLKLSLQKQKEKTRDLDITWLDCIEQLYVTQNQLKCLSIPFDY